VFSFPFFSSFSFDSKCLDSSPAKGKVKDFDRANVSPQQQSKSNDYFLFKHKGEYFFSVHP